jgi:hypothetical protein
MGTYYPRLTHGLGWRFAIFSCVLDNKGARESVTLPANLREASRFPALHRRKELYP